jgi:hypothetical protein
VNAIGLLLNVKRNGAGLGGETAEKRE